MKSLINKALFVAIAAFVAVLAAQARAEVLFEYNFNHLIDDAVAEQTTTETVNLTGLDAASPGGAWKLYSAKISGNNYPGYKLTYPLLDTVGNDSVVMKHPKNVTNGSTGFAGTYKDITPISFTSSDYGIEMYVWVKSSDQNVTAGFEWDGAGTTANAKMGLVGGPTAFKARFVTYNPVAGIIGTETLSAGHWYEFRGTMDFRTPGGLVTLAYRDRTTDLNGTSNWITEDSLKNIAMGLPYTDADNYNYTITGIGVYSQRYGTVYTTYVDNFKLVSTIPEPSALALLACGLIGLLAYAWRRRK